MLPKQYRLTHDKDFSRVYRLGKFFSARELNLKYVRNGLTVSRFGFVVSTKIAKKANVRNLLKRRLRALVQDHLAGLASGYDVVIGTRPGAPLLTYDMLGERLEYLLQKAQLLGNSKLVC